VKEIHDTALVASHVQSLVVVTVNVPTPPSAGAAFNDVFTVT
jgi:hypothetical protein